jgi:thiamine-phosphate pyrophosphorylase
MKARLIAGRVLPAANTLIDMLRCAITDRMLWPGTEPERRAALVRQAVHWAQQGIDLIQLREKDLPVDMMIGLAKEIKEAISTNGSHTRLVLNSTPQIAIAAGAHGVHLTSHPIASPDEVRRLYAAASLPRPIVTITCHSVSDVESARSSQPDAILFAPVFGKTVGGKIVKSATGLDHLRAACRAALPIPVYALGGVTAGRAILCRQAGAAGVAGIRLFHHLL